VYVVIGVGTTVNEIIEGLASITAEKVFGKFFSLRPKSNVKLGHWLDSWIKIGKTALLLNDTVIRHLEAMKLCPWSVSCDSAASVHIVSLL